MDLITIAPATLTVVLAGADVSVRGLSLHMMVRLFTRFPDLMALVERRKGNLANIISTAPDAAAAIMAAGIGAFGDAKAEASLSELEIGSQFAILEAVLALTFPGGFGPFVDRLTRLGLSLNTIPAAAPKPDPGVMAPSESSPSPPSS